VGDNKEQEQFIQLNGWERDQFGFPTAINQLGALDVDILIDEGPDTINSMEDTFDLLVALAKSGAQVPPTVLIELSSLPSTVKKTVMQLMQQKQDPMEQQAMMIKIAQEAAKVALLEAQANKANADAGKAQVDAAVAAQGEPGQAPQVDTPADIAKAELDLAKAAQIRAQIERPEQPDPGMFALNVAKADTERAKQQQAQAATMREIAAAEKTAREARTIDEAPAGMLTAPPPRPPGGAKR
jgi:hypothetical protein